MILITFATPATPPNKSSFSIEKFTEDLAEQYYYREYANNIFTIFKALHSDI